MYYVHTCTYLAVFSSYIRTIYVVFTCPYIRTNTGIYVLYVYSYKYVPQKYVQKYIQKYVHANTYNNINNYVHLYVPLWNSMDQKFHYVQVRTGQFTERPHPASTGAGSVPTAQWRTCQRSMRANTSLFFVHCANLLQKSM